MARTDHMRGWRNRIVGHGEEAPDQLLANPANWRIHGKAQQEALAGVLDDVGWVQDIIVNRRSGHIVDGHLRVSLAISRNEKSVPVVYVDLDEREEALVLATIDPLSAMAAADKEQLDALLRDVATGEVAVQAMLSELAEKNNPLAINEDDPAPELDLLPDEKYDYVLLTFTERGAFEAAVKTFGLERKRDPRGGWGQHVGLCRVVDGKVALERLLGSGNPQ